MPDINTVQICQDGNWGNVLHTFPRGLVDEQRTTVVCSDPGNAARPQQFTKDTSYFISYLLDHNGGQEKWRGECHYDAGGAAGVEFRELDMQD